MNSTGVGSSSIGRVRNWGRVWAFLAILFSCADDDDYAFREGERIAITVLERVSSWRGECVPLATGDTFILTIGAFDLSNGECRQGWDEICRQAPLVPDVPSFAVSNVTTCSTGAMDDRLALYCSGETSTTCAPTMSLHVSSISPGQKRTETGYIVVRWNISAGTPNDAGVVVPCLEGCEEGFRVRIEMLDR